MPAASAASRPSAAMEDMEHQAPMLSGDLGILQRYLERQFARQNQLLLDLTFEKRPKKATAVMSPMSKSSLAISFSDGDGHYQGSHDPNGALSPENVHAFLDLPETMTRDLEDQLSMQPGHLIRKEGQRDSSRASFVRHFTLDHHMAAQKMAIRIDAARRRTRQEAIQLEETDQSWRALSKRFVLSSFVSNFMMAMIVFNAVLLGVEIDISARMGQNDIPSWFGIVNTALVLIFVAEILMKLFALGFNEFWKGEDWIWNAFDFGIVSISVTETIIDYWAQTMTTNGSSSSFRVMRSLRLVRTLRGLRIIRLFRYFSALRGLILSIFSTLSSLLWTLLLLLILFYTFSCIFTQLVTDHCRFQTIDADPDNDINAVPECPKDLAMYWGNVMDSMVTLFKSITGGINWAEAYVPLKQVSLLALSLMNLYIVIGFFTILNVVTGVFVNTAIESASADKDIATLKQMEKRSENMASLIEVFQDIDETHVNQVSIEDLEEAFSQNKMSTFMESLGISTDDVWGLFLLLDADGNGAVDLDEFVTGCMQLRGPAKSLQIAKMSFENKLTRQAIKNLTDQIQDVKDLMVTNVLVREYV